MFERILVPLDGSELGELALPFAEEVAAAFGSEVILLHVCETKVPEYHHTHQVYLEKMVKQTTDYVRAHRSEDAGLVRVKAVLLDGDPAAQITEHAEQNDISLLIMVSHGRSGIMPWSMGSTAARILNQTVRPVLFIRAREPIPQAVISPPFGQIMLPLDGSTNGEAALPYIRELTRRIDSELTLFQVVAPGYHVPTIGGQSYVSSPKAEIDRLSNEARQYLDRISAEVEGSRATIKLEVRVGNAAEEILKFAGENNISLVAMSSHGYSGSNRWPFGNVTHKILHSGQMPVFLARARL
jgi:nucleotide-binding universal stress UspA family protein